MNCVNIRTLEGSRDQNLRGALSAPLLQSRVNLLNLLNSELKTSNDEINFEFFWSRYFAVTSPIMYSQHRQNTTPAYIIILSCWSVSLAIGLPIMCGLNHRPETEQTIWSNVTYHFKNRDENQYIKRPTIFMILYIIVLYCFLSFQLDFHDILVITLLMCQGSKQAISLYCQRTHWYVLFTIPTSSSGVPLVLSTYHVLSWLFCTTKYFRYMLLICYFQILNAQKG